LGLVFLPLAQASRTAADESIVRNKILIGAVLTLLTALSMAADGTLPPRSPSAGGTNASDGGPVDSPMTQVIASPSSRDGPRSQSQTLAESIFPEFTIRRTVPEVRFQFSVADEHGQLVTSISPSDLRVFDNQAAVQGIRQFSRMEDLSLQLGILLDVSDSVQKTAAREKLAAQIFVQHVLRPQTDRAFLMAFARDVKLWQPSTGDATALRQSLDLIQQAGYATNLYDGLFYACFGQFPQSDGPAVVQRVVVLFSDGEDTGSLHGMPDVIALAERNEIQIFALSIHARRKPTTGDEVLRRLADETGGRFYAAASDKELLAIFTEMEQQMRAQYAVSFHPQQEVPGYHTLRVELTSPQKMRVRARQGYYLEAP
jgi:Ca-activated chloride channel family protein